jgi:PKD repeat protein
VNASVIFQNTSRGDIIRYQWFFGDGSPVEYGPDQVHVFRFPGTYSVTLLVTDINGNGDACGTAITVIP